jgi:hypothetical protein
MTWTTSSALRLAVTLLVITVAGVARAQPMWGVCGHFLHTDQFYDQYGPHWRLERTLPHLQACGIQWVREPIYALANPRRALVASADADADLQQKVQANRQVIDDYLGQYGRAGVKVMVVAMVKPDSSSEGAAHNDSYFRWLGELIARHPCVAVVEMHNEPNLKHFWSGTVADYVQTYRRGAAVLREHRPDIQVAVGSMSSLWFKPGIEWFEEACRLGVLEFADAVSVHPYNKTHPPEADPHHRGGAQRDREGLAYALDEFWALVQRHAKGRPLKLYLTELGYSSGRKGMAAIADEQRQADYLGRLMMHYLAARLRGLPIEAVFWYDFKNDGLDADNAEHHFGLMSHDLERRKPAFEVYRSVIAMFPDLAAWRILDQPVHVEQHSQAVKTMVLLNDSANRLVVAYWRLNQVQDEDGDFTTRLTLAMPAGRLARSVHVAEAGRDATLALPSEGGTGQVEATAPVRAGVNWLVVDAVAASP